MSIIVNVIIIYVGVAVFISAMTIWMEMAHSYARGTTVRGPNETGLEVLVNVFIFSLLWLPIMLSEVYKILTETPNR